ncbi:hypothetical protein CN993_25010 [Bacillus thuringiensis]|nr:hypothetical protein CN993_25010 [Bacillus thuringiensis]
MWQSLDRFLAVNVPFVLEFACYICIVRSGGKHNSKKFHYILSQRFIMMANEIRNQHMIRIECYRY